MKTLKTSLVEEHFFAQLKLSFVVHEININGIAKQFTSYYSQLQVKKNIRGKGGLGRRKQTECWRGGNLFRLLPPPQPSLALKTFLNL